MRLLHPRSLPLCVCPRRGCLKYFFYLFIFCHFLSSLTSLETQCVCCCWGIFIVVRRWVGGLNKNKLKTKEEIQQTNDKLRRRVVWQTINKLVPMRDQHMSIWLVLFFSFRLSSYINFVWWCLKQDGDHSTAYQFEIHPRKLTSLEFLRD